jgi:adenylate cyclase
MNAPTTNQTEKTAYYRFTFEAEARRLRATYKGITLADSEQVMVLQETRLAPIYYFPRIDVNMDCFSRSDYVSHCPFKGNASHYSLNTAEVSAENILWSYETTLTESEHIRDYVAFYPDQVDFEFPDDSAQPREPETSTAYANPLLHWVLHEAPLLANISELTSAFARQMRAVGIPIWDMTVVIPTLHPQVAALVQHWQSSNGELTELETGFEGLETPEYLNSPLVPLFDGAGGIRRRLDIDDPQLDFGVLHDLRNEGATDYVAMPILFSDGKINVICMSSKRPGGFTTTDLGHLYEVLAVMGRIYEVHILQRKARTLLDTYLGSHAGERVLNGLIRRGDSEDIRAVIWFCDLRGSTPLAQSMSRDEFLASLNEYFDAVAGALLDQGGQILRFIGDAALAIFPIEAQTEDSNNYKVNSRNACEHALTAASEAALRIKTTNALREKENKPPLDYGIALHLGDVSYGNIGTGNRLEFTVIGDAANRAARIESMCKTLKKPLLLSAEFVGALSPEQFESVGSYDLRGIDGQQEIFALPNAHLISPHKPTPL